MKRDGDNYTFESTGRKFGFNRGIIGLAPEDHERLEGQVTGGYDDPQPWADKPLDPELSYMCQAPLTEAERVELARYMIAQWITWGDSPAVLDDEVDGKVDRAVSDRIKAIASDACLIHIVAHGANDHEVHQYSRNLSHLAKKLDVQFLVTNDKMSIEDLDEKRMRAHGWVRCAD